MKKKIDLLKSINLCMGTVTYNNFEIDPFLAFEQQKWSFKEDILQITFDNTYLIDVGWYPEFDPKGSFHIVIIKNFDWESPIFEKKCKNIKLLKKYIQQSIDLVDKL